MATFKKSIDTVLLDDRELYGKPYGARVALVCPHPDAHDPLALGLREATPDQPIIGLDGGEGHSAAMDVGAEVWWVVEPLVSELPVSMLTLASGQIELYRCERGVRRWVMAARPLASLATPTRSDRGRTRSCPPPVHEAPTTAR